MSFQSILFGFGSAHQVEEQPEYFIDLNLDQVVNAITAGKQEYNLKPFFYTPLQDLKTIQYRQAVARDLEQAAVLAGIKTFSQKMAVARRYMNLLDKLYFKNHKEGWFLEAVLMYTHAVRGLAQALSKTDLQSQGLSGFREYLKAYVDSGHFKLLVEETEQLKAELTAIQYCVVIKGNWVRVYKYAGEIDYSIDVEETFQKFRQGAVKDYKSNLAFGSGMNHVEAQILECVARLHPDVFKRLENYWVRHGEYVDEIIQVFDREIQFYVAYLDYIERVRLEGFQFCYPQITTEEKEVYDYEGFDLALARKRVLENAPVVCNDFSLRGQERILVVSGPNQGGKTTFARTFGQLHYLACLGCCVPGRDAKLFLFDQLFTHFEKEEDIRNLRGKLQDDLIRIHHILEHATPRSIIIMNEIFTSTSLKDAVFLGKNIMEKIIQLDLLCVCVTFLDELSSMSEKTVSMVSTVVPENPAVRTYKIVRKPADGLAYAISIAEKYQLTYEFLKDRIKP